MESANLISLLKSFSKTETREVQRFLQSPFFNTRHDLRQLFDHLSATETPEKTAAWQQLFPEKKYDDTAMRLLMSYLNRLLERYLIFKENQRDDLPNKLKLVVAYRRRGLNTQYERHLRALERNLDEQPLRNVGYHEMRRNIDFEKQDSITTANPTNTDPYRQLIETIDVHYLATRLRLLCHEAAQKNVYRTSDSQETDHNIIKLARHEKWADYPAIQMYLTAWEMLAQPENEVFYQRLKSLLEKNADVFEPAEMRELYLAAINHCIRRLNDGSPEFAQEALQLYRAALEAGFLFEDGFLSRFTFHNIVAAGLRANEPDWVRWFIHEYQQHLEKKYSESSVSFNLARLEFAEGKHNSVLQLLQNANYRDPLLHLAAKVLLIKTCHALSAFDLMASQLDAMKNYLHRSEVIGYHKTNYLNFVRYLDKILSVNRLDKKKMEKLRQKIRAEKILSERTWLLSI